MPSVIYCRNVRRNKGVRVLNYPEIIYDKKIEIKYKSYIKILKKLLNYVPQQYFNKLKYINIIESSNFSHNQKREKIGGKKNKIRIDKCRGYFSGSKKSSFSTITLIIDNMICNYPKFMLLLPIFKYLAMSDTLYHEIGHHIHNCLKPEYSDKEKKAEYYNKLFSRKMGRKRFWYLYIIIRPISIVIYFFKNFSKKK